jgi:NADH-quinone oxidoreductase subunit M
MCIGIIYDKVHSKEIKDFGGLAAKMPVFASLFLLFILV